MGSTRSTTGTVSAATATTTSGTTTTTSALLRFPPPPPPIVYKLGPHTESAPSDPLLLFPGPPGLPPDPTVNVFGDPTVKANVLNNTPPPPPPPEPCPEPPPPPPPTTTSLPVNGAPGDMGPLAPTPKPKPPSPLVIPVKTGFSFTKKSLKILILVVSYQRKSPLLVMNTL